MHGAADTPKKGSPSTTTFREQRASVEATTIPRDPRNKPTLHCEARPAPRQNTFPRDKATGETLLIDSTTSAPWLQPVHFRMIGNLTHGAAATPMKGSPSTTTFRAERATVEATTIPRDPRNKPTLHCEARPAPQQNTFPRDKATGETLLIDSTTTAPWLQPC
ncbi:hypothetical protein Lal_00045216 [Lupinus albus]|nr:hypothetical protein Lal_00045216 [Lupinus albus]